MTCKHTKTMHSPSRKALKVILHRVEEIYPCVMEGMNCLGLVTSEHGSYSDSSRMSDDDENNIKNVKVKDEFNVEEEEEGEPIPITCRTIKCEPENCLGVMKPEHDLYSDSSRTSSVHGNHSRNIKVEEDTDVVGEGEPMNNSFQLIKSESENCLRLVTPEQGSYSDSSRTFNADENHCRNIKVEEDTDVVEEGEPMDNSFEFIKCEPEITDSAQRPYKCWVCQNSFRWMSNLKIHQRIHNGERPYKCDVCGKSFRQMSNLKVHQSTHSGEHPYNCDVCGKSYSCKKYLKVHQSTHSGDHPYNCDVCGKSFSHMSNLNRHKRIHSGERPYNCDVCGKSFSCKKNLKRHMRIHSGERPYTCNVCGMSFSDMSSQKRHQRTHSRDRPYNCDVSS